MSWQLDTPRLAIFALADIRAHRMRAQGGKPAKLEIQWTDISGLPPGNQRNLDSSGSFFCFFVRADVLFRNMSDSNDPVTGAPWVWSHAVPSSGGFAASGRRKLGEPRSRPLEFCWNPIVKPPHEDSSCFDSHAPLASGQVAVCADSAHCLRFLVRAVALVLNLLVLGGFWE